MKKYLIYFLIGFITMIVLTFLLGINDDLYLTKYHQGIWFKDIVNSLTYYILWVLPNWWLLIIIGSILIGFIINVIYIGIGKLS